LALAPPISDGRVAMSAANAQICHEANRKLAARGQLPELGSSPRSWSPLSRTARRYRDFWATQVIGSSNKLRFEMNGDRAGLMKLAECPVVVEHCNALCGWHEIWSALPRHARNKVEDLRFRHTLDPCGHRRV
jgi:hypothetical protein